MKTNMLFVVLLGCISHGFCYEILLIVTPVARGYYPLVKAQADILHERGHEVTLISGKTSEEPLYREIAIPELLLAKPDYPNIRVFVSHGGFSSITEDTSTSVPLVVIPIHGDQHHNAEAVERGQGIFLDFSNFTEKSLAWVLGEVSSNIIYTESAKEIQETFLDRPMNLRELINYYSKLVIHSSDARHFLYEEPSFMSYLLTQTILATPLLLFLFCCRKCIKCIINSIIFCFMYAIISALWYLCIGILFGIYKLFSTRQVQSPLSERPFFMKKLLKRRCN